MITKYFKSLNLILVVFLFIFLSCVKDKKTNENQAVIQVKKYNSIPLNIFEGVGVENLKLGMIDNTRTSDNDSVINLKNILLSFGGTATSIACGEKVSSSSSSKNYTNKEHTISIDFESESFPESDTTTIHKRALARIFISNNKAAKLQNGLCIGISTYADVIKMYAPIPKHWVNESYLSFDKKGVSFRFDDESILTEIEIFKPR